MADKKRPKNVKPKEGGNALPKAHDDELVDPKEGAEDTAPPVPPEEAPKTTKEAPQTGHSEAQEDEIDAKVEEEAERFRHKIATRPRTVSFTPSTVQRRKTTEVQKTWKPIAAGVLLMFIAIIGVVTSTNLFMTVNDQPLYAPETGSIKGYILNKDGERLIGARVTVEGTDLVEYTNENGKYEIKSIPKGEHVLMAVYPGYSTVRFPTMILGGTQLQGIGDTNLTLPKVTSLVIDETSGTAPLKGKVTDNNLNPELNATVRDETSGKNDTTDKNGTFDLGVLSVGKHTLVVTKAGFYIERQVLYVTPGRADLEVRLLPGNGTRTKDMTSGSAQIKGHVVDMQGAPIPNALIEVNGSATTADGTGAFSIPVDAGEVTLTATGTSKTSTIVRSYVDVSGGQHDLEVSITFDAPVTLKGDREALQSNLTTCGAAIIAMSMFMLVTAYLTIRRKRFWIAVTGSLFGAVMMLVTFQYALILGLVAFGILIFSRREFE